MKIHTATGSIQPKPPFDWDKSLDFLGEFQPMAGEQTFAPGSVTKTLALDGQAVVFRVQGQGAPDSPKLQYTLYSAQPLDPACARQAVERIRFFLSTDDDLSEFYAIARRDPKFAPVVERLYGLHQVKFLSPFENALWAILTQRTPMRVAHNLKTELIARYGPALTVNGQTYRACPAAAQLLPVSQSELAALVKNERKAQFLRAAIEAFAGVSEDFLYHAPTPELRAWLLNIKGIGVWSADFILLRGLGRMGEMHFDADSKGAEATARAVSKIYSPARLLTPNEVAAAAAPYGAHTGYWAYYLRTNER